MNKAFVREDTLNESDNESPKNESNDDLEESPHLKVPVGSKNYMTPKGYERLKSELHELLHKQRPELTAVIAWAAGNGDRSENADYIYGKRRLREMDRRIRFLSKRLELSEIVDPAQRQQTDQVFFGATVTVRDLDSLGSEAETSKTYTIVGIDEINLSKNHISWTSPIARALSRSRVGDVVTFPSPKGIREIEVLEIQYRSVD